FSSFITILVSKPEKRFEKRVQISIYNIPVTNFTTGQTPSKTLQDSTALLDGYKIRSYES
ncbi:hypothetical protein, partial [Aggregatibacter actinomycetemcomitans]|uniref:hypothetical protein n=1 Tax=Aggregatibacter actinomycetemcomitans TaxID=714 RepID=UPI001E5CD858